MKSWILAFRPKTLTAAIVPIFVGTALAWRSYPGHVNFRLGLFALISALCIQIGTNLVNDAVDFQKGTDTEARLGPVRVTQSGLMTSKQVMSGAFLFFLVALLFGLPLVRAAGAPLLAVGLLSIFCGYIYTGGPFPLAYYGWGDLFVILFFGLVAVSGTFFVETGHWDSTTLIAGLQVGFLCTILIAVNNLRDKIEDSRNYKKTLAVRFGATFVRWEIASLSFLSLLGLGFFWWHRAPMASLLPILLCPLAYRLLWNVFKNEPSRVYNKFLAQAAALHLLFGILLSVGLLWH